MSADAATFSDTDTETDESIEFVPTIIKENLRNQFEADDYGQQDFPQSTNNNTTNMNQTIDINRVLELIRSAETGNLPNQNKSRINEILSIASQQNISNLASNSSNPLTQQCPRVQHAVPMVNIPMNNICDMTGNNVQNGNVQHGNMQNDHLNQFRSNIPLPFRPIRPVAAGSITKRRNSMHHTNFSHNFSEQEEFRNQFPPIPPYQAPMPIQRMPPVQTRLPSLMELRMHPPPSLLIPPPLLPPFNLNGLQNGQNIVQSPRFPQTPPPRQIDPRLARRVLQTSKLLPSDQRNKGIAGALPNHSTPLQPARIFDGEKRKISLKEYKEPSEREKNRENRVEPNAGPIGDSISVPPKSVPPKSVPSKSVPPNSVPANSALTNSVPSNSMFPNSVRPNSSQTPSNSMRPNSVSSNSVPQNQDKQVAVNYNANQGLDAPAISPAKNIPANDLAIKIEQVIGNKENSVQDENLENDYDTDSTDPFDPDDFKASRNQNEIQADDSIGDIPSPKYEIEIEDDMNEPLNEQPQEHFIISPNGESNEQSRKESEDNSNDSIPTVAFNQINHGVECVVVLERADDLVAEFSKRSNKNQKKLRKIRQKKRCPISSDSESDYELDITPAIRPELDEDLPSVSNPVPAIESDSETLPTLERQEHDVEYVDEDAEIEFHPVSPQQSQSSDTQRASVIFPGPRQQFDYGNISPIALSSSEDEIDQKDDKNKTNETNNTNERNQNETEAAEEEEEIIDISSDEDFDIQS